MAWPEARSAGAAAAAASRHARCGPWLHPAHTRGVGACRLHAAAAPRSSAPCYTSHACALVQGVPYKLQPRTITRRIQLANSAWALRSACGHVGYAFSAKHVCLALTKLSHLLRHQSAAGPAGEPGEPQPAGAAAASSLASPPAAETLALLLGRLQQLGGFAALSPWGLARAACALSRLQGSAVAGVAGEWRRLLRPEVHHPGAWRLPWHGNLLGCCS